MSINSRADLVERLQDQEYRALFVSEHIDTGLRFQLRALRESKGSQALVSKEWGKAQSWICKLESPNYGRYSLSTLKEIAAFYDVGLLVQFVPFSTLADWTLRFPEEALSVPPFSKDVGLIRRKEVACEFPDRAVATGTDGSSDRLSLSSPSTTEFRIAGRSQRSTENVIIIPQARTGEHAHV